MNKVFQRNEQGSHYVLAYDVYQANGSQNFLIGSGHADIHCAQDETPNIAYSISEAKADVVNGTPGATDKNILVSITAIVKL